MRNLIIFIAFTASLAGVCAAAAFTMSDNHAHQRNSAGADLPSLHSVSPPSWFDGATEALGRQ